MLKLWLGHHHHRAPSVVHRLPAGPKLAVALLVIGVTIAVGPESKAWFGATTAVLVLAALASRISPLFLVRRLLLLSPFVLGVVLANAFRPSLPGGWPVLVARSAVCLFTVVLLANTTPFGQVLVVLRRVRIPALLVTTLALMHRYLFVLVEESERMRRARASRTLHRQRRTRWRVLASLAGHLFLRASERAERIYDAMCARGWK